MPIYEYEVTDGPCALCGGRFELMRSISDDPLTECPQCERPVRKLVSQTQQAIIDPLSSRMKDQYLNQTGLTKYVKSSDGTYERAGGSTDQPERISAEDLKQG